MDHPALGTFTTPDKDEDRSSICIEEARTTFKFILSRFYISSSMSSNKRNVASKMMTDIRTQFISQARELIMDEPCRQATVPRQR